MGPMGMASFLIPSDNTSSLTRMSVLKSYNSTTFDFLKLLISDVEATRFHHRQLGELSKKLLRLGLAFHCLLLLSICSIVVFKRSCLNRPYIII